MLKIAEQADHIESIKITIVQQALLIICLGLVFYLEEQPDYFNYHKAVNQAEEYIVEEDFASAQQTLEVALMQFDFCFVKDLLLASQINLILGNKERSINWAKRALQGGYLLTCLQQIPVFQRYYTPSDWEDLDTSFPELRKEYLKGIDIELLNEFSRRYTVEQEAKRTTTYQVVVQSNFDRIKQLLNSGPGFLGEAQLGLDYSNLSDGISDCDAGNSKVIVTLLHYAYPVAEIGEGHFLEAIAQGRLHPREFARIYTFERQKVSVLYRDAKKPDRSLPDYQFNFPFGPKLADLEQVNKDRARFGIGQYEVDQRKKAIELKYGLKLRFSNDL